jgi:regulator of extracellular matrix RemA (YlzA/DUF370 family)
MKHEKFKVIEKNYETRNRVLIVTDDDYEFVVAVVPDHIKHQRSVAKAIAESLTKSKFALEELV